MTRDAPHVLTAALRRLLRPLVRVLLRHGVAFGEFADIARTAYVEVAHAEFPPPGRRQTLSHVAVLTGVHRHDVKKVLASAEGERVMAPQRNRAARVIDGWLTDPDFSDAGEARTLALDPDFRRLVARYSGDITPRAILDELVRVGAIEREGERLRLLTRAYVPAANDEEMLRIVGESVADLLETLDYNLRHERAERRLQISVVHDNFPDEVMRQVELVSRDKAMSFLTDLNAFLKTQDRDGNADLEGSGRNRAGVGVYFFSDARDANTDPPTR